MVHIKITQLIIAASVAAASVVGFAGIADAAPTTDTVCAQGALAIVTDDSGVQHEACVASAVAVPVLAATESMLVPASPVATVPATPTAPTTSSPELPKTGSGSVGLLIAALLVGSGSVASLVSRRKP